MKYIFKEKGDKLEFVGDFESLYRNDDNPWDQSGDIGEMSHYYKNSRKRLIREIVKISPDSLLEIGCGLGYVTKYILDENSNCDVFGMDISKTAISKAKKKFPNIEFIEGDIRSAGLKMHKKYDIIILNQLLWYVLTSLKQSIENCTSMLNPEGKIIVSQAFLKTPQKYGKDICDGFEGLENFLIDHDCEIEYSDIDVSSKYIHNDGLIVFRRRNQ
jgi:SAM-dependent methyltransferase